MPPRKKKTVIGWAEQIALPDWCIDRLAAKVDTGAKSSALHVDNLEVLGDGRVRFEVVLSRKKAHRRKTVVTRIVRWGRVRSSTGEYTKRCFVRTRIRLGDVEKEIDISLVSREKMLYRMLLGRETLKPEFMVDVSKRRVLTKPRRRKKPPGAAHPQPS